jgi:hypothetical protein
MVALAVIAGTYPSSSRWLIDQAILLFSKLKRRAVHNWKAELEISATHFPLKE